MRERVKIRLDLSIIIFKNKYKYIKNSLIYKLKILFTHTVYIYMYVITRNNN